MVLKITQYHPSLLVLPEMDTLFCLHTKLMEILGNHAKLTCVTDLLSIISIIMQPLSSIHTQSPAGDHQVVEYIPDLALQQLKDVLVKLQMAFLLTVVQPVPYSSMYLLHYSQC